MVSWNFKHTEALIVLGDKRWLKSEDSYYILQLRLIISCLSQSMQSIRRGRLQIQIGHKGRSIFYRKIRLRY